MKLVYCQSSRELKEPSQNRQQKSSVQFQGFCVLFLLFLKFIVFWIFASFFWQPLRSRSSRPKFNSLVWIRRMFSVEVSKLISLKCFGFSFIITIFHLFKISKIAKISEQYFCPKTCILKSFYTTYFKKGSTRQRKPRRERDGSYCSQYHQVFSFNLRKMFVCSRRPAKMNVARSVRALFATGCVHMCEEPQRWTWLKSGMGQKA